MENSDELFFLWGCANIEGALNWFLIFGTGISVLSIDHV